MLRIFGEQPLAPKFEIANSMVKFFIIRGTSTTSTVST